MPAILTDIRTVYVTISLSRHRLDIKSVVINLCFRGEHCWKRPGLPLSFLISLELTADISHWGVAGL